MKRGPRFPWDVKTHQTKTFIDGKSKEIIQLLFQRRKNVSVVSTFRFHAIGVRAPKTIGPASRTSNPSGSTGKHLMVRCVLRMARLNLIIAPKEREKTVVAVYIADGETESSPPRAAGRSVRLNRPTRVLPPSARRGSRRVSRQPRPGRGGAQGAHSLLLAHSLPRGAPSPRRCRRARGALAGCPRGGGRCLAVSLGRRG